MTVIAFRPRPSASAGRAVDEPVPLVGTFRSPRGRVGHMDGSLRVRRLVIVPCGTFVSGVVTGELREHDGSLVGLDTRRVTLAADLVRRADGDVPVLRSFEVDLMGLTVVVPTTSLSPRHAPRCQPVGQRR